MTMPREFAFNGMRSAPEALSLSQEVFALLRDLIVRRTGIYFDDTKRSFLADKLSEGVASLGMTSFLDYYYLLRYDSDAGEHWSRLMDWLAVPETFFWRQPEQLTALARILAPAHFAAHPGEPLRIWSAACCSGEEPLSIAIALAEAGITGRYPVELAASDGSPAMLARARRAVYGERSFRQLPANLRAKYFQDCGNGTWMPQPALGQSIRWSLANLANASEVATFASAHVIFCRNVFIYFSEDAIRSVVKVFAGRMPQSGVLFLGASEALARLGVNLELAEIGGGFAYVQPGRRRIVEALRPSLP
jgi:chemotaxis protein methyltransferase CheR